MTLPDYKQVLVSTCHDCPCLDVMVNTSIATCGLMIGRPVGGRAMDHALTEGVAVDCPLKSFHFLLTYQEGCG
jgi:hypothetical protein